MKTYTAEQVKAGEVPERVQALLARAKAGPVAASDARMEAIEKENERLRKQLDALTKAAKKDDGK